MGSRHSKPSATAGGGGHQHQPPPAVPTVPSSSFSLAAPSSSPSPSTAPSLSATAPPPSSSSSSISITPAAGKLSGGSPGARPPAARPAAAAAGAAPAPPKALLHGARSPDGSSQVVVSIRGDLRDGYDVKVNRQPRALSGFHSTATALQVVGGLTITVLTIVKLWEEIRLARSIRKELRSLVSPGDAEGRVAGRKEDEAGSGGGGDLGVLAGIGNAADAAGFASIVGLDDVKRTLEEVAVLPTLNPGLFTGIRQPPRGALLFGPPGTGKTKLARAVATEARATFLPVTGSNIASKWYGQSEQNVKALFERARRSQPAVIFIDEVDSLLSKRSDGSDAGLAVDRRVTNEFLGYIDGIHSEPGVLVIAATNFPWLLDEAALSRFACRLYVPLPGKLARAQLMAGLMDGVPCSVSTEEFMQLSERADNYSGRDLVHVCREASLRALRELTGNRLVGSGGAASGSGPAAATSAAAAIASTIGGSGGAAAAHTITELKLVEKLADAMRERGVGRADRRLRRHLTNWKAAQGAGWLNVEEVMEKAEVAASASAAAPSAAPAATTGSGADSAAPSPATGSAPPPPSSAASTPGGGGRKAAADGGEPQQAPAAAAALPAEVPAFKVGPTVVATAHQAAASKTEPLPAACGVDGSERADSDACYTPAGGVAVPAGNSSTAASGPTATTTSSSEASGHGDGTAGQTGSSSSSSSSGQAQAQVHASSSTAAECGCAQDGSTPSSAALPTKGEAAASTPASANSSSTAPAPAPPATSPSAPAGTAPPLAAAKPVASLQDFKNLKPGALRPVSRADIEAALAQVRPSDFNLAARYKEWDAEYGTGGSGTAGGNRRKEHLSMYA